MCVCFIQEKPEMDDFERKKKFGSKRKQGRSSSIGAKM